MSKSVWRKGLVALAIVGLLAGYGTIRSRGGWAEFTQMPAKRDDSTPAIQNGFELLGIARVTEEERSPRLVQGDLNLGGSAGPIGSTRIWFRLPRANGSAMRNRTKALQTSIRFPNGEVYPASYEMADVAQAIATVMIPAGHPPVEWIDVEVKELPAEARWRLKGIPRTPRALPADGVHTFDGEGVKVIARAFRQGRMTLNEAPRDLKAAGSIVEVRMESPRVAKEGREVHVQFDRFVPEFMHPTEVREKKDPGELIPKVYPATTVPMNFPYADAMKRIGFQGRLEVVDVVREPITFKNVKWTWMTVKSLGKVAQLVSDTTPLPDGSIAYVSGSLNEDGGALQGYWQRTAADGAPGGGNEALITDLEAADKSLRWKERLLAIRQGKQKPVDFTIGTVNGFVVRKRLVRTVPFELLIPVERNDTAVPEAMKRVPDSVLRILKRP